MRVGRLNRQAKKNFIKRQANKHNRLTNKEAANDRCFDQVLANEIEKLNAKVS
ncbi:hypothetical protein [Agaribacterium sp. ZY112]|uniref:hypothetical protein n=1 Tax=Agaribacterium sp. ZY112 TaxID=3233574 RepID=UPI003523BB18